MHNKVRIPSKEGIRFCITKDLKQLYYPDVNTDILNFITYLCLSSKTFTTSESLKFLAAKSTSK